MIGVDAVSGGGADDRLEGGAEIGPPVGAKATSYLAIRHHKPEIAFAPVIVGRRIWMLEKGEQAVADGKIAFAQSLAVAVARLQHQGCVQVPLQAARYSRRVLASARTSPGQADGAEQRLRRGAKPSSPASISVAQLRNWSPGQICHRSDMARWAAKVRQPDLWSMSTQHSSTTARLRSAG